MWSKYSTEDTQNSEGPFLCSYGHLKNKAIQSSNGAIFVGTNGFNPFLSSSFTIQKQYINGARTQSWMPRCDTAMGWGGRFTS